LFAVEAQQPSESGEATTHGRDDPAMRPQARRQSWVNEYRPNSAEKKLLVASEDEKRFAGFLSQPDTGLFRLFPLRRRKRIVSLSDLETGTRPGFNSYACMYSFSREKHGHGLHGWVADPSLGWAELRLEDGVFVSGFMGESLGLLVRLGDVSLETVTLLTPGVVELASFAPPLDYSEAVTLRKRNAAGYEMNGFKYNSSLAASVNNTYALRSTAYKRADMLISFRVVRQDEGGSVSILWKKLKSYPRPSLKATAKAISMFTSTISGAQRCFQESCNDSPRVR